MIRRSVLFMALVAAAFQPAAVQAVTLDECIHIALDENPDARAADYRVTAARAAIREAQSAFYPLVTLSGALNRTDNPPQAFMMALNQRSLNMSDPAFNPNEPQDTENLRMSAGAKMRLLDGGQRRLGRQMAGLGAEASKEALRAVQNDLIYQVIYGYHSVLQASAFVTVQQETVQSLEESLRVAEEHFKAGTTFKTDVLNLEVKLAQAREDLIRAKNGLKLAVVALNTAIGRDAIDADALPAPASTSIPPPPTTENEGGIEDRPELIAARKMAAIKEKAAVRSNRDYAPVLNAFGSLDWDSDVSSDFEQSYMVGVMLEWDVFTGFRRGAATAGARANLESARAEEQKARNQLRLDLKQAYLQATEAWERLGVAGKSVESAREALRITQERYAQGAANITDLLTAQVGFTATQTRNVAAQYDYLSALANYERAQGGLVKTYVPD